MAIISKDKAGAALALVATSTPRLPAAAGILSACGIAPERGGFLRSIMGRKPAADTHVWEDNNLVFPLGDAQVAVSLMPGPIPWSSLEGPCATAPSWPEAAEAMRRHKYHFVVAVIGGTIEAVERRVILTRLVGAVTSDTDAVGVYWGEGTLVHEPKQLVRGAKAVRADAIPGPLWIDVRVEENADGSFRCFTTGLAPLGFLEIEIERATVPPEELMGFVGDTACYVVNKRLHIRDGETMGRTPTEQYKVRHARSMFDRPAVMRLVA